MNRDEVIAIVRELTGSRGVYGKHADLHATGGPDPVPAAAGGDHDTLINVSQDDHHAKDHGASAHSGIVGETDYQIRIALVKALPAATNNATLDDDWLYKKPYNVAHRINKWYVRFESNLAANATFELRKNGTAITGASVTVSSGTRESSVDDFTETVLANGDSIEVWQTVGNAEDIGGSAYIFGDRDVVAVVS